jgi:hypothetical protein
MHSFRWYFNRFKTMSGAEISFRLFQYFRYLYERLGKKGQNKSFDNLIPTLNLLPPYNIDPSVHFPDEISIFGIHFNYSKPTNWHHDISSGLDFPRIDCRNIDIRTSRYGSAKMVWEINRMLFLPWICINYKSTGNSYYLELFEEKITGWVDQNPYLVGVNWYSNIEVNIRLISWVICWEILDAGKLADNNPVFRKFILEYWLPVVYSHCRYSYFNPSLHSSANNHLIAEHSGLFLASLKWSFPESGKWHKHARKGLEEEIQKQHSVHGINREEAAEYIQFITDFIIIPFVAAKNTHNDFSDEYALMLKKIIQYIYEFTDSAFNFPQYGDEDDGKVLLLSGEESFNNFRSLLISGALLFDEKQFLSGIHETDIKNDLLFGITGHEKFRKCISSVPRIRSSKSFVPYKEDGHFIIKDTLTSGKEIYIHIDAAPLGYLSIAAHGHADALSFILHINGTPFFIDSGTYTYHTHPEFRSYFVGTMAHNTVRVNRLDQAINGGPTLWISHFNAHCKELMHNDNFIRIAVEHDGYRAQEVIHAREFLYNSDTKLMVITDTLRLKRNRQTLVEIPFHLYSDIRITQTGKDNVYRLQNRAGTVLITTDKKLTCTLHCGESDPILGWYSGSFSKKQPTPMLLGETSITKTTVFKTEIAIPNG